jgi:hypothetical protein
MKGKGGKMRWEGEGEGWHEEKIGLGRIWWAREVKELGKEEGVLGKESREARKRERKGWRRSRKGREGKGIGEKEMGVRYDEGWEDSGVENEEQEKGEVK